MARKQKTEKPNNSTFRSKGLRGRKQPANDNERMLLTGVHEEHKSCHAIAKKNQEAQSQLKVLNFLLRHARFWTPIQKPENIRWGKPKVCYHNSAMLAFEQANLTYCQGLAIGRSGFIVEHAFCITPSKEVIDVMWREPASVYWGVPFDSQWLSREFLHQADYTGHFGNVIRPMLLGLANREEILAVRVA